MRKSRGMAVPSAEDIDGLTSEIRSRRLSRAPSALIPGVDAIAAPVFDYRNHLVAVICVVARSESRITGWDGSAVQALTAVASQLSARLGFAAGENDLVLPADCGEGGVAAPVSVAAKSRGG